MILPLGTNKGKPYSLYKSVLIHIVINIYSINYSISVLLPLSNNSLALRITAIALHVFKIFIPHECYYVLIHLDSHEAKELLSWHCALFKPELSSTLNAGNRAV